MRDSTPTLWNDIEALTKPRIGLMVMLTALVGYVLASQSGSIDRVTLSAAMLGVFLTASASGVLNQVMEKDSDARMDRTSPTSSP